MMDLLIEAADAVARALVTVNRAEWGRQVGTGPDGTPTTMIDHVADRAVKEVVEASAHDLNYVSEESEAEDRGGEWTIVVDPVDGTHNAIAGVPVFSVSLAISKDDLRGTRWALVRNLATGETYRAEKGKGARLNGERIRVSPYDPRRSLFSLYLGERAADRAFELARIARRVRNLGAASLDMCLVASGSADLYYMRTTLRELELRVTDVAASSLLLWEAGGEVYGVSGDPLNMPLDPRARSNLFALGDPRLLEVVL